MRVIGSWHVIKKESGIWADSVHLTEKGYNLLATSVIGAAADMANKRKAESEAGNRSKRQRRDSTVTISSVGGSATRPAVQWTGRHNESRSGPPDRRDGGRTDGRQNRGYWRGSAHYKKKY